MIKGIEDEIVALRNLNAQRGGSVNLINSRGQPDEPQRPSNEKQQIFSSGPEAPGAKKEETPSDGDGPVVIGAPNARGAPPAPAPAPAPKSAFSFSAGGDLQTRTGIANFLRNAGVTDPEDIKRITREFTDAKGDVPYTNNPGQKKYADGGTISMALIKAAETVTFGNKGRAAAPTGMAAQGPAPALPLAGGNSSHIVTIDIGGGRRDTFNMASEADASGLAGLLSQLRNAKAVS